MISEKDLEEASKGFIGNNNYKLIKAEDMYCEIEAEITESSLNPYNTPHGGFVFGLADTAAGVAARTSGKLAVTVNATIDYLHPARGKKLKAIAKNIKDGKTISVYDVYVYDEEENLICKSSVTYFYINE